jgi:hypothetical protein
VSIYSSSPNKKILGTFTDFLSGESRIFFQNMLYAQPADV